MSLPLVLLHGWGLTPDIWQPLVASLGQGQTVLTPALPGHAQAAAAGSDLDAWAQAVLPQLPEACTLCGWSLGGLLAMYLASHHPQRVARLILVGSTPRFVACAGDAQTEAWPHGLDEAVARGFVERFGRDAASTMQRFIALQALGDHQRRAVTTALSSCLHTTGDGQASALAEGLQILTTTDLRHDVACIGQPTLLLHGDGDALMPVGAAQWLTEHLPRAQLLRFDGCGHAPFLSRIADCAAAIGRFAGD